ncbi:MAG: YdeI/OmpD-associated family protein [Myxococcota bacterium]|jgi:hypothetical protein|nr:YdeI/OmpD-associated family protein [Myxococcota bacterium]
MSTKRKESPTKKSAADPADPVEKSSTIRFAATLESIGPRTILRLPDAASTALPSRGQVAVHGTLAGQTFETVIEPDGEFGHWMNVDAQLRKATRAAPGSEVKVEITPTKDWPEPVVPPDLADALSTAPSEVQSLWSTITPMARWEWVRWVNETKNLETRQRRVEVSLSKMSSGKRRPCCFNLASCTDPELARSGKLPRS